MKVLIRFWRSLTKKDSFESAEYEIQFFLLLLQFFDVFFTDPDPDFSGSDTDFWPIWIRIQTQEKKFDPDPGKNPDPKQCFTSTIWSMPGCLAQSWLGADFSMHC